MAIKTTDCSYVWLQTKVCECGQGLRPRLNTGLSDTQRCWGGICSTKQMLHLCLYL